MDLLVEDVNERRELAKTLSGHAFVGRFAAPVLVGQGMIGGELKRRERPPIPEPRRGLASPRTLMGRRAAPTARRQVRTRSGAGLRAATMDHLRHSAAQDDPSIGFDRRMAREVFLELRKKPTSPARRPITLGRIHTCDVILPDHSVSNEHAAFRKHPQSDVYQLVDMGSHNGTWLGDQPLVPRQPVALRSGQLITFGRMVLTFMEPLDFYIHMVGQQLQFGSPR